MPKQILTFCSTPAIEYFDAESLQMVAAIHFAHKYAAQMKIFESLLFSWNHPENRRVKLHDSSKDRKHDFLTYTNERMCFNMKRYIVGFASASCFGMLCACAARADMMLHVKSMIETCLHCMGLI